jgi:hypothetical protein
MKIFSSFHNPKTRWYGTYYASILVIVTITEILTMFQIIHQNILQNALIFFEGFFSLFMLVRNEQVGNAFLRHVKYVKSLATP